MRRLNRPPRKRSEESLVALVDVVFFLLVFALLIGRMDATAPFDVAPPVAFSGVDLPGGGLTISIDVNGDLALEGEKMSLSSIVDEVSNRLGSGDRPQVRINADNATALRFVLPLIDEIRATGVENVVLVVTPDAG